MNNHLDYATYFNGEWVPYSDVKFPPHDRGFLNADLVFDRGRTFNGVPFRLEDHISRLYSSLKQLRIDPNLTHYEMLKICREGVLRNKHRLPDVGDFVIHPIITRGTAIGNTPSVCVIIKPIDFVDFAKFFMNGAHAIITKLRTYSGELIDSKIELRSNKHFILAELEALDVDPNGLPLLLDGEGNVTKGLDYNLFLVKNGILQTPPDDNILQAVSRKVVLELAKDLGLTTLEENIQSYDLYTADEVFFTRTDPRILPVAKVNNRSIGEGKTGPITQKLLVAHSELVSVDIVGQSLYYSGIRP